MKYLMQEYEIKIVLRELKFSIAQKRQLFDTSVTVRLCSPNLPEEIEQAKFTCNQLEQALRDDNA